MGMNYWLNMMIIGIIIGFVIFVVSLRMVGQRKKIQKFDDEDGKADYALPILLDFIKKRMTVITTEDLYAGNPSEEEFKRRSRRRQELKETLKNCNTGDLSSKIYIREFIYELLLNEKKINETKVNWTIPFDDPEAMTAREKFETLLYLASRKHGSKGLGYLIDKYNLNAPKKGEPYNITANEIDAVYKSVLRGRELEFEDKLRIVSQIVYSHYKGFGIADEIRDMDIDGVSGGVSGASNRMKKYMSTFEDFSELAKKAPNSLDSLWIMYKGDSIHLSFLSFDHESELRRVVTNIYKYGYPGQLSESRPYIINEMFDSSRVMVVRPKLAESWAFFVRKKYDGESLTLEEMFPQRNNELLMRTLGYLMLGERTTAITGAQGSGKTTLLTAIVKYIKATYTLRVQETKFEANLRSVYPERNILTFQETDSMTGQDGLDLFKKSDGDVTILGEVATDPVAAWAIQTGQVASRFTLFTHHAMTSFKLIQAIRNSLLKIGMFSNERTAEQQVVNVLEFDVHMDSRIVERITEISPVEYAEEALVMESVKAADTQEEKMDVLMDVMTTYFRQHTQRKQFIEQNIIEYRNGEYVPVNPISEERQKLIEKRLTAEECVEFRAFIEKYWGE